jgi:hypothetical protein
MEQYFTEDVSLNSWTEWDIFHNELPLDKKIYYRSHASLPFFLILLPIPLGLEKLVFRPLTIESSSIEPTLSQHSDGVLGHTYDEGSKLCIEHLIYYDWINDLGGGNDFFAIGEFIGWGQWVILTATKKVRLVRVIKENISIIPPQIWENFKPIFEFIEDKLW